MKRYEKVFAATRAVPPVEIDPGTNSPWFGSAIGGDTIAYVDYGLHPERQFIVRIS